jgi:hypothetical protein
MKHIVIAFLIIIGLCLTAHAYKPNVPYEPPHEWGERETVGGSKDWEFADTFVLGGMIVMTVMIFALPEIFSGELERWPVYKFTLPNMGKNLPNLGVFKFPTRRLCESY